VRTAYPSGKLSQKKGRRGRSTLERGRNKGSEGRVGREKAVSVSAASKGGGKKLGTGQGRQKRKKGITKIPYRDSKPA